MSIKKSEISLDVATEEVTAWLDFKKIGRAKREAQEANIEELIEAIQEGYLIVNADKTLEQTLKFPVEIGDGDKLEKITYSARLDVSKAQLHLQRAKQGDLQAHMMAYVCALTGNNVGIIKKMDSIDYSLAKSIAVFFV